MSGEFPDKSYDRYVTETPPRFEEPPEKAFDDWDLERFDAGKLDEHRINMMLINAIKFLEKRINDLEND